MTCSELVGNNQRQKVKYFCDNNTGMRSDDEGSNDQGAERNKRDWD